MADVATTPVSGLEISEFMELQRLGAEARAQGRSELDNPFYRPEAMPRASGESTEIWAAKEEAWRVGYQMEHAMRSTA